MQRISDPIEAEQFLHEATNGNISEVLKRGPKEKITEILNLVNRSIDMLQDALDIIAADEATSLRPPGGEESRAYGMTKSVIEYKLSERMQEKFACDDALVERISINHESGKETVLPNIDYSYLIKYLRNKRITTITDKESNVLTLIVNDSFPNLVNTLKSNIKTGATDVQISMVNGSLNITFLRSGYLHQELMGQGLIDQLPGHNPNFTRKENPADSGPTIDYRYLIKYLKYKNITTINRDYNFITMTVNDDTPNLVDMIRANIKLGGSNVDIFRVNKTLNITFIRNGMLHYELAEHGMMDKPNVIDSVHEPNYQYLLDYLKDKTVDRMPGSTYITLFLKADRDTTTRIKANTTVESKVDIYQIQDQLYIKFPRDSLLHDVLMVNGIIKEEANTPTSPYDYTYLIEFIEKHQSYDISERNGCVSVKLYNLVADQAKLIKITIRAEPQVHIYDRGDQIEFYTSRQSQLFNDLVRSKLYMV